MLENNVFEVSQETKRNRWLIDDLFGRKCDFVTSLQVHRRVERHLQSRVVPQLLPLTVLFLSLVAPAQRGVFLLSGAKDRGSSSDTRSPCSCAASALCFLDTPPVTDGKKKLNTNCCRGCCTLCFTVTIQQARDETNTESDGTVSCSSLAR